MKTKDAIRYFGGSAKALGAAVGSTRQAVIQWDEDIPKRHIKPVCMALRERAAMLEQQAKEMRKASREDQV